MGTVGFVYYLTELQATNAFQYDGMWVELIRILAIICGAFMLHSHNWARWLALAWISLRVVLSAFHSFHEFAIHCLFYAVIAWIFFVPRQGGIFAVRESN
jgi:hypothetical protein